MSTAPASRRRPARRGSDIGLVAGLALLAALIELAVPESIAIVRAPAAIAIALVLPGYAMAAALFPPLALGAAERFVISVGLSIAATILTGVALYAAGVRLTLGPWTGLLTVLTLAAAGLAVRRRHGRRLRVAGLRLGPAEIGALCASVVLLGAAGALGLTPLSAPSHTQGYAALWTLPAGRGSAQVGVISGELRATTFVVDVHANGAVVSRLGPFRLQPGARWTRTVALGTGAATAYLYAAASPRVAIGRVDLRSRAG